MAGKVKTIKPQKIQETQTTDDELLTWDKQEASKRLLRMCHEIEVNIDITLKLRDAMVNSDMKKGKQLNLMLKVSQICNSTAKIVSECLREMNELYGLTRPETSSTNAVQVIIGDVDDLPEDTIDG